MPGVDQWMRDADRAVAAGDLVAAEQILKSALIREPSSVDIFLRLAGVSRATNQLDTALIAIDQVLRLEPLHFVGLLMRANLLEQLRAPQVGEAYGRALAQRPSTPLPPWMTANVDHANDVYAAFQAATNERLSRLITPLLKNVTDDEKHRIGRFCTNATRLTKPFHSEPTHYHYPGLIEREFHDKTEFPWLQQIESATDDIECELNSVINAERAETVPYVQYSDGEPLRQWNKLNQSSDWSAIHLLKNGKRVEANAVHCPVTMELLGGLPQPDLPGLSPNAMFSLLAPFTHIPSHTGVANTRLVCHLPLVVPDHCWFRVGADTRSWRRGDAWIFDDTIEHEAKNESEHLRVVLIFDIWHPQLTHNERAAVAKTIANLDYIDTAI